VTLTSLYCSIYTPGIPRSGGETRGDHRGAPHATGCEGPRRHPRLSARIASATVCRSGPSSRPAAGH